MGPWKSDAKEVSIFFSSLIPDANKTLSWLSLSHVWLFATSGTAIHQAPLSFTISQSLLKFMSSGLVILSNHLRLSYSLLLWLSIFLSISLFQWVGFLHQVAKVLELQLQHQSFQWIFRVDLLKDWLVWYPRSPRDSQDSSLAPQFKSINSSALGLLYGVTLTFVYDY